MVHIKELLLLIGKNSPCGGNGFPLSRHSCFHSCGDGVINNNNDNNNDDDDDDDDDSFE